MVHGILGDDVERAAWLQMTVELGAAPERLAGCATGWAPTLDALVAPIATTSPAAVDRLSADIDDPQLRFWHTMLWRPWYAALWVEAAVLGRHGDASERIERGHHAARDNPIASAIVGRAAACSPATTTRSRTAQAPSAVSAVPTRPLAAPCSWHACIET